MKHSGGLDNILLQSVHCFVLLYVLHRTHDYPVLKGGVQVGSDESEIREFHTVVLSTGKGETGVQLTATEDGTELMLVRLLSGLL